MAAKARRRDFPSHFFFFFLFFLFFLFLFFHFFFVPLVNIIFLHIIIILSLFLSFLVTMSKISIPAQVSTAERWRHIPQRRREEGGGRREEGGRRRDGPHRMAAITVHSSKIHRNASPHFLLEWRLQFNPVTITNTARNTAKIQQSSW